MTINLYLCICLFFVFAIVVPTICAFVLKKHKRILKIVAGMAFAIFLVALFVGTTFSIRIKQQAISIYPNFSSKWFSLHFVAFGFTKVNILLNLVCFLPLGFVVFSFSSKHQILKTILLAFFLSIAVEALQWVLPISRNTEILDVILNTASGALSSLYCFTIKHFGAF